nr:glycosyltransferase [Bacteroidota bacterium]
SIGRLAKQKGYEYLLPSFKEVVRQLKNVKLLIFGPDQSNGFYQNLARELKLDNSVIFCGVKENIYEILAQADMFVSASLWEGLPRGHVEACLCQCPVVSTDIPGSIEVITHNVNGWLVPPENSEGLADALLHLLNNPKLCSCFTEEGLRVVKNKFDIKKKNERLERLYVSLLTEKGKIFSNYEKK